MIFDKVFFAKRLIRTQYLVAGVLIALPIFLLAAWLVAALIDAIFGSHGSGYYIIPIMK